MITYNNSDNFSKILQQFFAAKMNKSRIDLISLMIISLAKIRTVNFQRLAANFETDSNFLSGI